MTIVMEQRKLQSNALNTIGIRASLFL